MFLETQTGSPSRKPSVFLSHPPQFQFTYQLSSIVAKLPSLPTPTKGVLKPRWPLSTKHMKSSPPPSSVHGSIQVKTRTIQCPSRVDTHSRVGSVVDIRSRRSSNNLVDKADLSSSTLARGDRIRSKEHLYMYKSMMYFRPFEPMSFHRG